MDPPLPHLATSEADQRFRVAFEHAPIGMTLVAPDGRVLQVNPALCRILGYAEPQLLSMTRDELTHPEDRPLNHLLARRLLAGEVPSFQMEKRFKHVLGHYVWVDLSVALMREADGSPAYFIAQIQDISDRKQIEVELEYQAHADWLTGLLNRRGFDVHLARHVAAVRGAGRGALMLVDLDDFKYINDTLGHQAGDRVISTIASTLRSRLRETDILARLGGDEFAILVPDGDADGTVRVAEAVLRAVRGSRTISGARAHRLSASIGVALFDGSHTDPDAVFRQADLALYASKEAGRDQVSVWSEGNAIQRRIVERMDWVRKIEHALDHDGLELYAMPIVSLPMRSVEHYELLIRLREKDGGIVAPAVFLDTAERFDLIQQIDRWVAMSAIAALRDGFGPAALAVNISGRSIGDDELLEFLRREAGAIPGGPGRLMFEVTETAAVADIATARRFTEELHAIGYTVALDDFGAGFGSFAYLKHLEFDVLKIDGDFVKGCPSNATDRLIIQAVVDIARGLGKRTVAEFTESEEIISCLTRLGVDMCQGYALGMPMPMDRVVSSLLV